MLHVLLITVHAAAGVVAFVTGCLAVRHPRFFSTYYVAMLVMAATLIAAVVEEWTRIDAVSRGVFAGLLVLATFMVVQAERARRLDPRDPHVAVPRFRHLGFTLVGLAVAYLVIQVLGWGANGWVAFAVALAASLGGHYVLVAVERRLPTSAPAPVPASAD